MRKGCSLVCYGAYLDMTGNAFIVSSNFFIKVEGQSVSLSRKIFGCSDKSFFFFFAGAIVNPFGWIEKKKKKKSHSEYVHVCKFIVCQSFGEFVVSLSWGLHGNLYMHLSNSTFLNRGFAAVFCPKCQCIFMAANTFCKLINRFKHVVRHLAAVHTIICGSVLNISCKIFWVFVFQSFEEEEKKEKKRVSQGNKESMIVLVFFVRCCFTTVIKKAESRLQRCVCSHCLFLFCSFFFVP